MRLGFKFLLIFSLNFILIYGQRVSLIGSYYVSNESTYKAFLLANKMASKAIVDLTLSASNISVSKNFQNLQTNPVNEIELGPLLQSSSDLQLNIGVRKCVTPPVKLINASNRPVIFVQFGKPIYQTGDDFKFRIFVLNNKMIPQVDHEPIDVSIYDSKGYLVRQFNDIKTSKFGVFEEILKIANTPNLGEWTLQVTVGDRKMIKNFNVQQQVEEDLEVFLDMPQVVAHVDRVVFLNIHVKDKRNKIFSGTANIWVSGRFKGSNKIEIDELVNTVDITGNRKGITIDFEEDLSIRFPSIDMILKFDVEVTDQVTKRSIAVSKEIEMKHKGRNTIQVLRKKYFKPGFKFPIKIRVKVLDGRPDNSFDQLSMTVKYENFDRARGRRTTDEKQFKINLKNGETIATLEPTVKSTKIELFLEFAGTQHTEVIDEFPTLGTNEYMQVTAMNKRTTVGEKLQYSVKASEEMEILHVLVFGQNGIVHSEEFPDAVGKDDYTFSIKITEDMKPESRGLAFYIKPDNGAIVYDEFSLILGFLTENSLEITIPEQGRPNEKVELEIKTESGSHVYLSAMDNNPTQLNRDNEISKSDIYNELVYYLNLKFPNSSKYHFERLSPLILEPVVDGKCDRESFNSINSESDEEDQSNVSNWPTRYFPDFWLDKVYRGITSGSYRQYEKLPNSYTTWRFYGISIHPEKGFAVAKIQPKIAVKNEISVQVKAPQIAYDNEIFVVEIGVFNSHNDNLSARVSLQIENGNFVDEFSTVEFNIKCSVFKSKTSNSKAFGVTILAGKMSQPAQLMVQPNGNGDMRIIVTATSADYQDKLTKIIEIKNSEHLKKDGYAAYLIVLDKNKRFDEIDEFRDNKTHVNIYGNLLEPALHGLEDIIDKPLKTDEERLLKFASALNSYKYFNLINLLKHEKATKAFNDITAGYQEAAAILHNILQEKNPKMTLLAAFAVQFIIDAQEFMEIDQNLVKNSLNFIKSQQNSDGSFPYDSNSDYHREIATKYRPEIQTSLIIAAFLRNENIKGKYRNEIQKTLNYLKTKSGSSGDYLKVIAAYVLALNGDINSAKGLIQKMENKFYTTPKHRVFYSTYGEIASYTIITKILLGEDPSYEVEWLFWQRKSDGSFFSPYDTALALQALYEFTKFKNLGATSLQLSVNGQKIGKTITNPTDSETSKISKKTGKLKVAGQGLGYVSVYKEQVETRVDTAKNFEIKINTHEDKIDLGIRLIGAEVNVTNLVVVEIELPRGYRYVDYDVQKGSVEKIDVQNDLNRVFFYISKFAVNQVFIQTIKIHKVFEFKKHQTSTIRVYDYYRTNIIDKISYSFDENAENCEKIEILRAVSNEMPRAQKIHDETEEAKVQLEEIQRILQNALVNVTDAYEKAQTAQNDVEEAIILAGEANSKADAALNITEEAMKLKGEPEEFHEDSETIEENNEQQIRSIPIISISEPKNLEESWIEADDAQKRAIEAEAKAQEETKKAEESQEKADKARKNAEKLRQEVIGKKIQAHKAFENIPIIETEILAYFVEIVNLKNRANNVSKNCKAATNDTKYLEEGLNLAIDKTKVALAGAKECQKYIQSVIYDINYEQNEARNARKASNLQARVIHVQSLVESGKNKSEYNKNQIVDIDKLSTEVLGNTTDVIRKVEFVAAEAEDLLKVSKNLKNKADEKSIKSQEARDNILRLLSSFKESENQEYQAKQEQKAAEKEAMIAEKSKNEAMKAAKEAKIAAEKAQSYAINLQNAEDLQKLARKKDEKQQKSQQELQPDTLTTEKIDTATEAQKIDEEATKSTPKAKQVTEENGNKTPDANEEKKDEIPGESSKVEIMKKVIVKTEEEKCAQWFRFCKFGI